MADLFGPPAPPSPRQIASLKLLDALGDEIAKIASLMPPYRRSRVWSTMHDEIAELGWACASYEIDGGAEAGARMHAASQAILNKWKGKIQ